MNEIILIGSISCMECKKAKRLLTSKKIDFKYYDEASDLAKKIVETRKITHLPILLIKDNIKFGDEAIEYIEKLK